VGQEFLPAFRDRETLSREIKASNRRGGIIAVKESRERGAASLGAKGKGIIMSKIDELKAEIERLPSEEFAEIFRWLSERDWQRWDKEVEAESQAGKLELLVREAREGKAECIHHGGIPRRA
jgi:hypothetical protein